MPTFTRAPGLLRMRNTRQDTWSTKCDHLHRAKSCSLFVVCSRPPRIAMSTPAVRRSRSSARPPAPSLSPGTLGGLPTEVLRLHLANHRLTTTGRRDALLRRLRAHLRALATEARAPSRRGPAPSGDDSEQHGASESDNQTSSEDEEQGGSRSPAGDEDQGDGQSSSDDEEHGSSTDPSEPEGQSPVRPRPRSRVRRKRASEHHPHSRRAYLDSAHRSRRTRYRSRSRSSSPSSTSSASSDDSRDYRRSRKCRHSSSSSSATSSSSTSPHRHRRRHRHKRRHHHRRQHRSSLSCPDEWAPPSTVSCAPPLSRRLQHRIMQGKYVKFDDLLLPTDTPPPNPVRAHQGTDTPVAGQTHCLRLYVLDRSLEPLPLCTPGFSAGDGPRAGQVPDSDGDVVLQLLGGGMLAV